MRRLGATGWDIFDECHSGAVMLDGAQLYDGSWEPTKSAAVLADSPLGMFCCFLPKKLWFVIEKETNNYREACISDVAQQQRDKQFQAQAKDSRSMWHPWIKLKKSFGG
ncbi:hypothetical protein PC118_g16368 [Phytophthora cactorum]|uniref:Uncharacterized protein n=1 Tax=Phytophthora cactorum TaxID=29920 RepID=A0A8T1CE92_9STRA|nr:hypothetical protein PC117_g16856 [Phytophthora cactorum]KAG2971295.1 hypothetical protein PC118_g16368 [Phytophthora cactorum]KAG3003525.1 hypothetical protein PC119_g15941 [Phytophthora cactorum]KAG3070239.1 hypothetical protein PC122_g16224 [Phytophthora cactorum]